MSSIDLNQIRPPLPEAAANANLRDYDAVYKRSIDDPEGFWAEQARELEWYAPWDNVLDASAAPFYKWFTGGRTNVVLNALDRHVRLGSPRRNLSLIHI